MLCDECGIHPANIHLTTIVNGEKKDFNLCTECMQKKKAFQIDFSELAGKIGKMFQNQETGIPEKEDAIPDIACAHCGTSYADYKKSDHLGCAQCYDAFRIPITEWLNKKYGASAHVGRVSGGIDCAISLKMKLDHLKKQQKKAIEAENYEEAAALRDQIRALSATREEERHGD